MAEQAKIENKAPATQELTTAQAIALLAESMRPQGPLEQAGFTAEQVNQLTKPPAPQRYRDIPWRSEETGATAIAHVIESKKFANGRVVYLSDYKHPQEAYIHESEGGRVPDGFHMWAGGHPVELPQGKEPAPGVFNPGFLQWRWLNFYQADLRRYIGREIQPHHCQMSDAIKTTAWIDGKVGKLDAE
jgi:hypothetical protein